MFQGLPFQINQAVPDIVITGLALDSREVQPGNLFVALKGDHTDGHRFIPQAIERGALAVIGSQSCPECQVPYIQVEDTRLALAHLSAAFYRFPGRQLTVVGVTGTDGKTTTANLIYQIMLSAGLPTGIISTVNATIGDQVLDTGLHVTTPEAPDIQRYLARMVAAGLTHVVLEATSHGLAQHRVTACEFDVAVVTNVTHEHLDYHGSFEAYLQAKGRLFASLAETHPKLHGNPRTAVLNLDDSSYQYLQGVATGRQIAYSLEPGEPGASLYATDVVEEPDGLSFSVNGPNLEFPVHSSLVGLFNVSNCLAAVGATVSALGLPVEAAQAGIAAMQGVPGRMERIDLGQDFIAIVDFAHTPNALRRALETVREITRHLPGALPPAAAPGRVIVVFGSAGLRDRQKRRMMAEVSADLADITILTAEDPRTESLDEILAEMARGAEAQGGIEGQTFWRIPDRGAAIRFAVGLARPGDLVVACGKGHEQSMCFEEKEYPWDDRTAMHAALAERLGVPGPGMPELPTSKRLPG
jgi:UDP-N-acetylmuramoyl-L-alanyl-D-glutamate--2,6-diaminopimelate ligase